VDDAPLLLALALGEAEAEAEELELDWASTIGERREEMTRPRPKWSHMVLCLVYLTRREATTRCRLPAVIGRAWDERRERRAERVEK
jgi:hypothetical protein